MSLLLRVPVVVSAVEKMSNKSTLHVPLCISACISACIFGNRGCQLAAPAAAPVPIWPTWVSLGIARLHAFGWAAGQKLVSIFCPSLIPKISDLFLYAQKPRIITRCERINPPVPPVPPPTPLSSTPPTLVEACSALCRPALSRVSPSRLRHTIITALAFPRITPVAVRHKSFSLSKQISCMPPFRHSAKLGSSAIA